MLSRLKLFAFLVVAADLLLLGALIHYTSWLFAVLFVFISAAAGVWLLRYELSRYATAMQQALAADQMPSVDHVLAVCHIWAALLLIAPGVLTDLMALVLLSPAGKWLARVFVASLLTELFPSLFRGDYAAGSAGEKQAKDEIIDVRVIDSKEDDASKGQ